jgi:hypothetical protein
MTSKIVKHLLLPIICFLTLTAGAQDSFKVEIRYEGLKGDKIFLGHYYGKQVLFVDSVFLDEQGAAKFSKPGSLDHGMYFLFHPVKNITTFFLLEKNQQFGIHINPARPQFVKYISSPENEIYTSYQNSLKSINAEFETALKASNNARERDSVMGLQPLYEERIFQLRQNIIKQYPNSLLSLFIKAMLDPVVPDEVWERNDTVALKNWVKKNYFNDVPLYDPRLVRSHFFEPKLEYYLNVLVDQHPDSLFHEVDWLLSYSGLNENMHQYMLDFLVKKFMDPKQEWNEEVLIHIYNNHIEGKDLHWMKEDRKRGLHSRVMAAIRTGKGEKISGINLPGTDHKIIQLDSIQSKYLLLVIWDVSCDHCRELLPAIDQVYNKSLKNKGVSMLAISFESTAGRKDWLEYIKANKLMNWKHMHYSLEADKKRKDSGKEGLSKTLSVRSFPLIYLLNDKKIILAKNPSLDSLPDRVE